MRNAGLDEAQAGIKIAGRNINKLRKWRRTKEPLDESEREGWKSWLKAQHSKNEDHGIWSHHFMANRWENSGWLYFSELQKSLFPLIPPSICHEVMGPDAIILVFWMLSFKPTFSHSSFILIKRFFGSFLLSAIRVVSSAYLRLLIFLPAMLIPACVSSSPAFLWCTLHIS